MGGFVSLGLVDEVVALAQQHLPRPPSRFVERELQRGDVPCLPAGVHDSVVRDELAVGLGVVLAHLLADLRDHLLAAALFGQQPLDQHVERQRVLDLLVSELLHLQDARKRRLVPRT